MNSVHDAQRLAELTALPLERKIQISQTRIIEWYTHYKGNVCVTFSGGKDSTVLLHLVRTMFPDVKAVFSNTGLEYPEIRQFATSQPNVDVVKPFMRFDEVISKYGYPLIGKEVAEAIYYARRISSQGVHVERERESGSGKNCTAKESGVAGKQTDWKRLEMRGGYSGTHPDGKCESEANGSPRQVEQRSRGSESWWDYPAGKRRRHELHGFKRGYL